MTHLVRITTLHCPSRYAAPRPNGRTSMNCLSRMVVAQTLLLFTGGHLLRAAPPSPPAGEAQFRALYKELVETNTTLSAGSCTLAAERMVARLKAAGFTEQEIHQFTLPGVPKQGGVVVVYAGRDPRQKAILLLAHLDVVEAKREDWTRDPFTLVEENGNF